MHQFEGEAEVNRHRDKHAGANVLYVHDGTATIRCCLGC